MIVEMILTPRQTQTIDHLEQIWQARESMRRWNDSDETCERLLRWLCEVLPEVEAAAAQAGDEETCS